MTHNFRHLVESTVTVTDGISRLEIKGRSITKLSITVTDSVRKFLSAKRLIAESVFITDTVAKIGRHFRNIFDPHFSD